MVVERHPRFLRYARGDLLNKKRRKRYKTKVNAHPFRMNDREGNSERTGFDLGTRMITRDIYVPNGTMKSTSRKTKNIQTTGILFLVRAMVINRLCTAVGRERR